MIAAILDRTSLIRQDIKRNIVSLRESADLFADIDEGDDELMEAAIAAEMAVKSGYASDIVSRGFHYTTAIEYPFLPENYLQSRFADGTYGVLYGSLEDATSIYETCFHQLREVRRIEGWTTPIHQERAVYSIHCNAMLCDVRGKQRKFPAIISDDYSLTQAIGKAIAKDGYPGVIYPSARTIGTNVALFSTEGLSNPRLSYYLSYEIDPVNCSVSVERKPGETLMVVEGRKWFSTEKK